MKKYYRNILKKSNSIDESKIVWTGKPKFFAYLFANQGFLVKSLVQ